MRHAAGSVEYGAGGMYAAAATAVDADARVEAEAFGRLFLDLRRALGVSLAGLSARLQIPIDVIAALEASDVRGLPPWPETARVVTAYTGLAAIDPRPVLAVMRRAFDAVSPPSQLPVPVAAAREASRAVVVARPRGDGAKAVAAPKPDAMPPLRRLMRQLSPVGVPFAALASGLRRFPAAARRTGAIAMILVVLAVISGSGSALNASFATLHPPIKRLVRSAQDYLLWRAAPVHEGMRWIQVDDPRSRKGDRLKAHRS